MLVYTVLCGRALIGAEIIEYGDSFSVKMDTPTVNRV